MDVASLVSYAAVTLYVDDIDVSVRWYADVLGLHPADRAADEFPYARYEVGRLALVLEPAYAATDPVDSDRTGAAALNLVVDRDPADIRNGLVAQGVDCTEIHESPKFATFLLRDPDGHRLYVTRPRRDPP
jgi:catechol 2,3-dioxygenase-like lactoylglutathione lyase family enzyme